MLYKMPHGISATAELPRVLTSEQSPNAVVQQSNVTDISDSLTYAVVPCVFSAVL